MSVTATLVVSFYVGVNIECILYGIELVLYFATLRNIWENRRKKDKSKLFYALFSTTMVLLVTVRLATETTLSERTSLCDFGYPGGTVACWNKDLATTSVVVLQLMTDALMIYRCRMVWGSCRVVVVPIISWFATLTLSIFVTWLTNSPGSNYHTGVAANCSFAYWSVSVFLHMTLTSMMCYRVMRYGLRVQERLGGEHASLYFAVVMTVIESVLPYTLSGVAFLVTLGVSSPMSAVFSRIYFLMMCISPQMLILQVATLDHDTSDRPDTIIKFRTDDTLGEVSSQTSLKGFLQNGDDSHGSLPV